MEQPTNISEQVRGELAAYRKVLTELRELAERIDRECRELTLPTRQPRTPAPRPVPGAQR